MTAPRRLHRDVLPVLALVAAEIAMLTAVALIVTAAARAG